MPPSLGCEDADRWGVTCMVFWQLTIDANDPAALARFWADALGYVPTPPAEPGPAWHAHYRARLGDEDSFVDRLFDPEGSGPPIWFQKVPESKAGKNRLHLDLYPTGRDPSLPMERRVELVEAKVTELTRLGARVDRRTRYDDSEDPIYFAVMHDPEGNEFCIG
jgi:Glyoxalase-like domain